MPPRPCARPAWSVFGERVVGIAVQPARAALGGGDDRVGGSAGVLTGVLVRRAVAAARAAALLAGAQVHPLRSDLHALLAFAALRLFHVTHGADVLAVHGTPSYNYNC